MTACSLLYLYPKNTQVLTVTGLQDSVTGAYLNAATITATLYDEHGIADAILNNISLAYVSSSNGTYQGIVPLQFNATLGGGYILKVTAVQAGVQSLFSIPTQVRLRDK